MGIQTRVGSDASCNVEIHVRARCRGEEANDTCRCQHEFGLELAGESRVTGLRLRVCQPALSPVFRGSRSGSFDRSSVSLRYLTRCCCEGRGGKAHSRFTHWVSHTAPPPVLQHFATLMCAQHQIPWCNKFEDHWSAQHQVQCRNCANCWSAQHQIQRRHVADGCRERAQFQFWNISPAPGPTENLQLQQLLAFAHSQLHHLIHW